MKKFFIILLLILGFSFLITFSQKVRAEELDLNCVRQAILSGEDPTKVCVGADTCIIPEETRSINLGFIKATILKVGVTSLVVMAVSVALGALVLICIAYGVYGMFVRSTAGDNEEKLKLSSAIFKNAIIGLVITFLSLLAVNIISIMMGLGNIWESKLDTIISNQVVTNIDCCQSSKGKCTLKSIVVLPGNTKREVTYCPYYYDESKGRWIVEQEGCIKKTETNIGVN